MGIKHRYLLERFRLEIILPNIIPYPNNILHRKETPQDHLVNYTDLKVSNKTMTEGSC